MLLRWLKLQLLRFPIPSLRSIRRIDPFPDHLQDLVVGKRMCEHLCDLVCQRSTITARSRRTVTRGLAEFRHRSLISTKGPGVLICDRTALEAMVVA